MNTYSISNLSEKEYRLLLEKWSHRRNVYLLISLLVIPAPFTISFALFCNNNIMYLKSGGRKSTSLGVGWLYIFFGALFPIIIVPLLRIIPVFGYWVLGTRIVD